MNNNLKHLNPVYNLKCKLKYEKSLSVRSI